jgi:hypothetical protein
MHAAWPDQLYADAAPSVAVASLELLTSEVRWIHRRVETIDLLGQELVRRQVSVDFTLPDALLDDLRIGPDGPWCVPLAILEKQPLRHFDLREADEPRAVLGREHGGPIAAQLVRMAARLAIAPDKLDRRVVALLDRVALGDVMAARAAMTELREHAEDVAQIATILANETSSYFLTTLAENYMLVALLSEAAGRRILKYSYDEHLYSVPGPGGRLQRMAQPLGWAPLVIDIPVPTAAHTASYHAEVVVPQELRMAAFLINKRTDELLSTEIERDVDRASLHAQRVDVNAEPLLVAVISAERTDFPTLGFATSAVTALLLLVGAGAASFEPRVTGSAVALLLAASVLFTTPVARPGEHRLVRAVLSGPRWLLSIVAIAALTAGASLAFGAEPDGVAIIWLAMSSLATAMCLGLGVTFVRAAPPRRRRSPAGTDEDRT